MRLLPLTLFLASALLGLSAEAEERPINSVRIEGSAPVVALETRAGQLPDPARTERDVRKLWETGRFEDVKVERTETEAGYDVVFRVLPRARFRLDKVKVEPASEKNRIHIESGTEIDDEAAHRAAVALRKQLVEEGYPNPKVEAEVVPTGGGKADLRVVVEPGDYYRVQKVNFEGDLGLEASELSKALKATRPRTIIPKLWRSHHGYSEAAVDADLARVRSTLFSRGFFGASVQLDEVDFRHDRAFVDIAVDAGPRYGVRRAELVDVEKGEVSSLELRGAFDSRKFCDCLFDMRDEAQKEGRLDFDARLRVEDSAEPALPAGREASVEKWVDLRATVKTGPPYTVGRIEFRGNRSFSDTTLRKAFVLNEAEPLDWDRLRRSLGRVNQLGVFQPLGEGDVHVRRNPETQRADVLVTVKQLPKGRWYLSGPLGPLSFGGPLRAAVVTRLPGWGRGIFEASTWYLTFSVSRFANPLFRFLPYGKEKLFIPMVLLERSPLPGQGWTSGFAVSPQMDWQSMAAGYGLTQINRGARWALKADRPDVPELIVAVERVEEGAEQPVPAGFLICEPAKSRWRWLRTAGIMGADLLLGARPY